MERKFLFMVGVLLVLVVGVLVVKASINSEEIYEEKPRTNVCTTDTVLGSCNNNNCPQQCGGTCGIRSCGCS